MLRMLRASSDSDSPQEERCVCCEGRKGRQAIKTHTLKNYDGKEIRLGGLALSTLLEITGLQVLESKIASQFCSA